MRKIVHLVYNPNAGEGQKQQPKEDLISMIEASGYECVYSSSKKKALKTIHPESELIIIAGGDGTVKKTVMKLLNKKLKHKRPIALLPFGTANNIANSLGISKDITLNIGSWKNHTLKKFDVGQVLGLAKTRYFLESFGFGLFPKLIKVIENKKKDDTQIPEDEFTMALDELRTLTKSYEGALFKIELDDQVIEEDCILLEVMNISSLGPNLNLSNDADPGDGYLDVIIVQVTQRELMERYLEQRSEEKEVVFPIKPLRTKKLTISCQGTDVHIDDELIEDQKIVKLNISVLDNLLEIVI